jgi:hypothetical protein
MMRLRGDAEDTTKLGSVRHLGATADAQRIDPDKATGQRDALDCQMPRVIRLNRDTARGTERRGDQQDDGSRHR